MTIRLKSPYVCASCRRSLARAQPNLHQYPRPQPRALSTQTEPLSERRDETNHKSGIPATRTQTHRPLASKTAPDPSAKRKHPVPSALFLASLGNPGKEYASTRHSAGHILLDAIREYVGASPFQGSRTSTHTEAPINLRDESPSAQRPHREKGESSFDAEVRRQDAAKTQLRDSALAARNAPTRPVCFFQSPSFMNVSGPAVVREFLAFASLVAMPEPGRDAGTDSRLAEYLSSQSEQAHVRFAYHVAHPALVVLHDELETPLGQATLKNAAGLSARGHNGLKSIEALQRQLKNAQYVRVGIGIGPRPQSRDPEDVARFVLQKMSAQQVETIRRLAGPVWEKLNQNIGSLIPAKPIRVDLRTR